MSYFFQHPFELELEPRMQTLRRKMWCEGIGIFWEVYRLVRLGRGQYPLDSILALADGRETRRRKIGRVISDFNLFLVENGMVSLQPGLTVSAFVQRDSIRKKAKRAATIGQKGYDDTLFPEEMQQMDDEARRILEEQVKTATRDAVNSILTF